jgi:hypothetical protein
MHVQQLKNGLMIVRRSFYNQFDAAYLPNTEWTTSGFQRARNDDGVEQLEIVLCR